MAKTTTSLRLDDELRQHLSEAARRERISVSSLIERLIREGLAMEEHPGIVFKGGRGGRRAAIAAGPDVWEIVFDLRQMEGTEQERIQELAEQLALHPRDIEVALRYAATHREEIEERVQLNERAFTEMEHLAAERARLLA